MSKKKPYFFSTIIEKTRQFHRIRTYGKNLGSEKRKRREPLGFLSSSLLHKIKITNDGPFKTSRQNNLEKIGETIMLCVELFTPMKELTETKV